ncbi:MAG TPA: hypothetical protein VH208_01045 [Myxococcaceae bacterium]|nr:hypothetical protein [Myxococcaceae bacterium]
MRPKPANPHEGDLSPLEAVAIQHRDGTADYRGALTQEVYHEAGHPNAWNGPGWYSRYPWKCRHWHTGPRGLADAQACARAKLARLQAVRP